MTKSITRGEARLMRDLNLADGTETVEELALKLDRHDEIFMELIRLRRELVRTRWWDPQRRVLQARIKELRTEQETL